MYTVAEFEDKLSENYMCWTVGMGINGRNRKMHQ